jgi:hypothetical protein
MKIFAEQLIIEVGRLCNLKCEHCLRGDAEDKTVDIPTVKKFLKEFSRIETLTFTGGEPTLYENEIIKIIDFIMKQEIPVGNFYIASNGLIKCPKLMLKLVEFNAYTYSDDSEVLSQCQLSNDEFHDQVPEENKRFFKGFSFYSERDYQDWSSYWINEGRAQENGLGRGRDLNKQQSFSINYYEDEEYSVETVYFNAEGYLLPDCDYSYQSQREMNPFKYGSKSLHEIFITYNTKYDKYNLNEKEALEKALHKEAA